jgi:PhnB protein
MPTRTPETEPPARAPGPPEAAIRGAHIAPWLPVPDPGAAIAFYRAAFGAVERYRLEGDGGTVEVAQVAAGAADIWLQREPDAAGTGCPGAGRLILTVADPDAVFACALAAGASEVFPVGEGHGWRLGRLIDPFGHEWEVGRRLDSPA